MAKDAYDNNSFTGFGEYNNDSLKKEWRKDKWNSWMNWKGISNDGCFYIWMAAVNYDKRI